MSCAAQMSHETVASGSFCLNFGEQNKKGKTNVIFRKYLNMQIFLLSFSVVSKVGGKVFHMDPKIVVGEASESDDDDEDVSISN